MTTGTKCCIHYKDGLPYCVECEKERDQRREELHAKLAGAEIALEQARADADHWKSECNALQRMAHEARAEIEALKRVNAALNEEIKIQRSYVTGRDSTIERKDKLIEQMRAEIEKAIATEAERWAERLNWLHTKYGADCSGTDSADLLDCVEDELKQVINNQSELIEQMREALRLALAADICPAKNYWQTVETEHHRGECWHAKAKAALAAERGE